MFDIDIECDKHDNYRYYVKDMRSIDQDDVKNWLLSTFAVSNAIADCENLHDRIAYEHIPSGNEYLLTITDAMKQGKKVRVVYQSFHDEEPKARVLSPYYLKVFKQRWYMVALEDGKKDVHTFSLDRMKQVGLTETTFVYPNRQNVDEFFNECYGIITGSDDERAERIIIKVTDKNDKRQYLRTLPLHHSQREIERHADYSIIEVTVCPTYDFIHELLSHGDEIEVLEPKWVRGECRAYIEKMNEMYKD